MVNYDKRELISYTELADRLQDIIDSKDLHKLAMAFELPSVRRGVRRLYVESEVRKALSVVA